MHHGVGLSANFVRGLVSVDPYLRACFDNSQDAIIVWSERPGNPKVHEFTSRRTIKECSDIVGSDGNKIVKEVSLSNEDLEQFTLKRLREIDTWRIHGDGKSFDNWLSAQEESHRESQRRKAKHERKEYLKENAGDFAGALESMKMGYLYENQNRPLSRSELKKILSQ